MAERRMFAKTIIDSDAFLDMPLSAQSLYFHLSMRADDDGFVNNPKKIQRMIGSSDDDLKLLIVKRFIITFESGVVVIKHWRIHNYIQNDRYKETVYQEEKSQLGVKPNKAYTLRKNECIQDGYMLDTQVSIDKDIDSIGKNNYTSEFESLWHEYPRKQGKENAYKAFVKARKAGTTLEQIRQGLDEYKFYILSHNIEPQYIKQGSTWFHQNCWNDDYKTQNQAKKQFSNQRSYTQMDMDSILDRLVNK